MEKGILRKGTARKTPENRKTADLLVPLLFLAVFILLFVVFAKPMGLSNMLNTMMNTAYSLLTDTALYIMAIAVITGALSALLTEFGVVELLNRLLSPLMRPLYDLPGAASLGVVTTYLSDNPAILALADDMRYRRYFKAYQIPALTNIGTSFGMGLIVTTFMLGLSGSMGESTALAVLCGNMGAVFGSILSTRLFLIFTKKALGTDAPAGSVHEAQQEEETEKKKAKLFLRVMNALMEGGKRGVDLGLGIIPGVLIICTLIMMLTNGPQEGGVYTGAAYEGIALLPAAANKISFLLKPLFGFTSTANIAVPVTALGSAGASLGIVPQLISAGQVACNDIAVFTAICMCWSGYLSTHVSMMDILGCSHFTGKAILCHTFGGLLAGTAAHWLYVLLSLLF